MKIEWYHTTSELKTLFRKEKDPRLAARIRAVYLGLLGKSAPQIATLLGYSRRTVQNWTMRTIARDWRGSGILRGGGRDASSIPINISGFVSGPRKAPVRKMRSASCEVMTSSGSLKISLASPTASTPSTTCCIGWATATFPRVPSTPKAIRRPGRPLKKSRCSDPAVPC